MKLQTCLIVLAVSLSCLICDAVVASTPPSKQPAFIQKVPDGYVLTVSQRVFKKIKNNREFAVTLSEQCYVLRELSVEPHFVVATRRGLPVSLSTFNILPLMFEQPFLPPEATAVTA